jgi:hypothetical protein
VKGEDKFRGRWNKAEEHEEKKDVSKYERNDKPSERKEQDV